MSHIAIAITIALNLFRLASAQILSTDGQTEFDCPQRQTIDTAYYGYCPTTYGDNVGVLEGVDVIIDYGFQPSPTYESDPDALELQCTYSTATDPCFYSAGGGELIDYDERQTNAAQCPQPQALLPQPSNGVNYRRSNVHQAGLLKRDVTRRPQFNCPFGSSDPTIYVNYAEIVGGNQVPAYASGYGVDSTEEDIFYLCGLSRDVGCVYVQNAAGIVEAVGSFPDDAASIALCPTTLCAAVKDGSNNLRRRSFKEPSALTVDKRQVDTGALRKRLEKDRQTDKKRRSRS